MNLLWPILGFLVAVSLLVTVHEFGHYWVARRLGFKVLKFSVGFGPALWRRVSGEDQTEYVLAALPLGGYVKLLDEREGPVEPDQLHRSFTRKPPWQRILVLLAGPCFNFGFAILLLFGSLIMFGSPELRPVVGKLAPQSIAARSGLQEGDEILQLQGHNVAGHGDVLMGLIDAMSNDGVAQIQIKRAGSGERTFELRVTDTELRHSLTEPAALLPGLGLRFWTPPMPATIGSVENNGPAQRAGLRVGDQITAVDGIAVDDFPALVDLISARPSSVVRLDYQRAGVSASVQLRTTEDVFKGQALGRIRIQMPLLPPWPAQMFTQRHYGVIEAFVVSNQRAWQMTLLQARMFARMIVGQVSLKNLSGPLSIAQYAGESARSGINDFISFLVVISLSLGFLNLLPIPMLDGGQIVYQLAEWIKGSPLPERLQALGQQIGIALLLLLMSVAIFNDVARQLG